MNAQEASLTEAGALMVTALPRLRRYACALVGDRAAADNLVQDTLERAWARIDSWRPDGDMRAWLFSILHNLHVDQRRRPAVATVPLDDEALALPVRASQTDGLDMRDLETALRQIPTEQREVLLLVALEDMSYEEIARTLGVPLGTVMSRLSRGRARLRGVMEGRAQPQTLKVVMNALPITEADLQAYVDGLLPEYRRAEIESYLAERPQEAQRLQAYRQDKQAIKALYGSLLDEPVPDALLQAARAPRTRSAARHAGTRLSRWSLERVAAGFALVFVGAGAGWLGRGALQPPEMLAQSALGPAAIANAAASSLPRQAAIAHVVYSPDVRRPVEIGADQEDQLVAWLSKRLGAKIRPPKLGALGYELIGGRLLPGSSGPVAQFMYHDATGQRLTLYVTHEQAANQDTGFRFAQEGPVNVFYWIDGKFGYALSAGIDKGELARIATAVYSQLQPS